MSIPAVGRYMQAHFPHDPKCPCDKAEESYDYATWLMEN